jgi:hypothetical protein
VLACSAGAACSPSTIVWSEPHGATRAAAQLEKLDASLGGAPSVKVLGASTLVLAGPDVAPISID